ncbi:unnamed protein product [Amoebophrya sp. A120]|nr:unnamed protein product [Amoebophrya sp. A120]|eukprot:GSA120T00002995001.1
MSMSNSKKAGFLKNLLIVHGDSIKRLTLDAIEPSVLHDQLRVCVSEERDLSFLTADYIHDLPILGCCVLVSRLEEPVRVNMTEFVSGLAWFFTAGQVNNVRDWISHFAVRVWTKAVDPLDGREVWLDFRIERTTDEVIVAKVGSFHKHNDEEVGRWWHCGHGDFPQGKTIGQMVDYARDQSRLPYSFVAKNCKHFVYDFFRDVLGERRDFEGFCQEIERAL